MVHNSHWLTLVITNLLPLPSAYDYERFFGQKIQEKKDDQSYRIFNKVNRYAKKFPLAESFSHGKDGDEIEVWCSNDYLGIGHHPEVMQTVR